MPFPLPDSTQKSCPFTSLQNMLDWEFSHGCSPRTHSEPLPFWAICPMMELERVRTVLGCRYPDRRMGAF